MAITLECPRCMNKQAVDEGKIGAEVPCKVCYHMLRVGTKTKSESMPAQAAKADPEAAPATGIKKATAKGPAKSEAEDDRPRRRRRREEEDDDDRDLPRRPRGGSDSSALLGLLFGAGAFVFFALLCGGGGMAMFLWSDRAPAPALEPFAENNGVIEVVPPQPMIRPGVGPGFPPPPENLDPNNPQAIDRVLALMRGPAPQRRPAFRWLSQAEPNHPRRPEIARQLEAIVEEHRNPFGNHEFFAAYFRWATRDNVPSLLRFLDGAPGPQKTDAMRTLGKLKDARAVEPLARRLDNPFDRHPASEALKDLGPIAESAVVKRFNDKDIITRNLTRELLQAYNTKPDVLLTQCLADIDAGDARRRASALQWLAKGPAIAERKAEVSKALNRCIGDLKGIRGRDVAAALEVWATAENIPLLAQLATEGPFGNAEAIRILTNLRDPEATKAVARAMTNFFVAGEARAALKKLGSDAEPAVIEAMMKTNDAKALREYAGLLGDIGTRERGIPALAALQKRAPQDFLLNVQINQSAKAIQARGK